ncbi:hypothetical protein FQN60_011620, partial [Etheostoma spectabile]
MEREEEKSWLEKGERKRASADPLMTRFSNSACLSPAFLRNKKPLLFSLIFRQRSSSSFFSSSIRLSLISQLSCFSARSFVNFSSSSFFSSSIRLSLISQLRRFSARSFVNFSSRSFFSSSICFAFFCQSMFSACSILRFSCRELHIVCKALNLVSQLFSFSARSFVNLSSRARLSETFVHPAEIQDFSVPLVDLFLLLAHLPLGLNQQDFRLDRLDAAYLHFQLINVLVSRIELILQLA